MSGGPRPIGSPGRDGPSAGRSAAFRTARLITLWEQTPMNSAYKKECWVALIAFAIVTILTHMYPFYFLFRDTIETGLATETMTIFGFPAHYFLSIVISWLLVIPLYWLYINISEKVDDEIAESSPFAVLDEHDRDKAETAKAPAGGAE